VRPSAIRALLCLCGEELREGPLGSTKLKIKSDEMSVLDLIKATVVCGFLAFLVYSFPVIGQIIIIGGLSLVWFSYAQKIIKTLVGK
jgi:hypothetical protein